MTNNRFVLFIVESEVFLIEIDKDNYAIRQIIVDKQGEIHLSCFEDCLAEGTIMEDEISSNGIFISKSEFNFIWNKAIKCNESNWINNKIKYPIGTVVTAICKYFYPQGAILKGKNYTALYVGNKEIAINQIVSFTVINYDDVNMWLITK